jgi:hypothetical protein
VDDVELVRGVEPSRNLPDDLDYLSNREGTAPLQRLAQSFAFQVLHGDVGRAIIRLT